MNTAIGPGTGLPCGLRARAGNRFAATIDAGAHLERRVPPASDGGQRGCADDAQADRRPLSGVGDDRVPDVFVQLGQGDRPEHYL